MRDLHRNEVWGEDCRHHQQPDNEEMQETRNASKDAHTTSSSDEVRSHFVPAFVKTPARQGDKLPRCKM